MPASLIPSFLLFCAVSAVTPGPANLCSMASAMAYGRRRALRQWRGIFLGYALVSVLVSLAVWRLGAALGGSLRWLAWAGAAYLLWLALGILRRDPAAPARQTGRCGFFTGLLVQLTNGKIMVFCAAALTTYALPYADSYGDVLRVALLLPLLGGPVANLAWLFAGAGLQRLFRDHRRPVSLVMALSLALCAAGLVLG